MEVGLFSDLEMLCLAWTWEREEKMKAVNALFSSRVNRTTQL
jgi:hypothetical protein